MTNGSGGYRTTVSAGYANLLMGAIAVVLVVISIVIGSWVLALVGVLVALVVPLLLVWRVRVDATGVRATPILGFPRVAVAADDIASAEATELSVMSFGGVGLRWRPGTTGVILRSGPALRVVRTDGRQVVITMPDPKPAIDALG